MIVFLRDRSKLLQVELLRVGGRNRFAGARRLTNRVKGRTNMDWRIFLTTFGVIFLAEMGDKTQLAAMTMAAQSKRPWAVFIGSALALTAVSAIGVVVGSVVGNYFPLVWIKRAAAIAFIVIGVLILLDKL